MAQGLSLKTSTSSAQPPPKRTVGKLEEVRMKVLKEALNNGQNEPEPG